jgi:hypothetical protein
VLDQNAHSKSRNKVGLLYWHPLPNGTASTSCHLCRWDPDHWSRGRREEARGNF